MYYNIIIGEWCYLCVEINDVLYILGKTGKKEWCQDMSRMDLSL